MMTRKPAAISLHYWKPVSAHTFYAMKKNCQNLADFLYTVSRVICHCSRSVTDPLDGGPLNIGKTHHPKDQSHFSKMVVLDALTRPNFIIVIYFTACLLQGIYFCQVVRCILSVQQAHIQLYGCKDAWYCC